MRRSRVCAALHRVEMAIDGTVQMLPLPRHSPNDLFSTDFEPHLNLPGFFPGAGGFFHGFQGPTKRFMFFGTDFGPLNYQRGLDATGGELATVATIQNLRGIAERAGVPLNECFLTNAVLCMRRGDSAMDKFPVWNRYPDYVATCARWHRSVISDVKPDVVVLMGLPHLEFGPALFPELASHWVGMKTLADVFNASKETLRLPSGPLILLMYHPSMWNSHHKPFKERIIEHLSVAARRVCENG